MSDRRSYDELADQLADQSAPAPTPSGRVLADAAAADAGREFLLAEYGTPDALNAALGRPGRPRVGESARGASPTVRSRVSERDAAALKVLVQRTGRTESELVREAVHDLLERHQLAG